LREQGAIVEEPFSDDEDGGNEVVDEKALPPAPDSTLDEKVGVEIPWSGNENGGEVAGSYESMLSGGNMR
jgi:hypothetical protein